MSRRGENIYQRKDGRWEARWISYYESGKAKYRSVYGHTYTEAKEKRLAAMQIFLECKDKTSDKQIELSNLCYHWLNHKYNNIKDSTYVRYRRIIEKNILPAFDNQSLCFINQETVNLAIGKLRLCTNDKSRLLSDKTVSDIICVFKSIWYFGKANGYPCCDLNFSKTKIKRTKKIRIIPSEKRKQIINTILQTASAPDIGILFTLFTGVRIGELCGLRWGDISFEEGVVSVQRTVKRIESINKNEKQKTKVVLTEPKTNDSIRQIPLPTVLLNYLKAFRKDDSVYLLTASTMPTEPHTYYMRYKTFLKKNQIGDYTFHELRHTFATQCVDLGFDIKSLSEILGHSNVQTTMNLYVHPTLQMKKRQMEMLSFVDNSPSK